MVAVPEELGFVCASCPEITNFISFGFETWRVGAWQDSPQSFLERQVVRM